MAASIGWMSVGVLARVTTEVLRRAGADRLFAQHGGERLRARSEGFRPSLVAGELAKWLIRIVILVAAANVLGMTQVSELLSQIVLWIPNPIVAVVTLLVAPLLARFVRGAIEVGAGEMGFTKPPSWVGLPRFAIIAFAVVIAINQIGIAANLINTLFIGFIGALSLYFGLAFALGGRDVAARIRQGWYESSQDTAARVRGHAETTRPALRRMFRRRQADLRRGSRTFRP
jgi:hypothetical protein